MNQKKRTKNEFTFAKQNGITKRQIGIVCYGKNWRLIYRLSDARIIERNKKIENAIRKIMEANNA